MTLKDVAKIAGVSSATVSYVLSGKKAMSPEVTKKVNDAVLKTKYKMNYSAKALRTGRNHIIALMVKDLFHPLVFQLIKEIEAKAFSKGYATIIKDNSAAGTNISESILFLQETGIDGIIWLPGFNSIPSIKDIPSVNLGYESASGSSVIIDDFGGGRMQAKYLTSLGHNMIVYISEIKSLKSHQERFRGFSEELMNHGIDIMHFEISDSTKLSEETKERIKKNITKTSAIACGDDFIAFNIIKFLNDLGIKIPDDISVIGFGDNILCNYIHPPLTTISKPIEKIGFLAVNLIVKIIENPSLNTESIIVPVSVKERQSVRDLLNGALN